MSVNMQRIDTKLTWQFKRVVTDCVVPENIHTPPPLPTKGNGNSEAEGGGGGPKASSFWYNEGGLSSLFRGASE